MIFDFSLLVFLCFFYVSLLTYLGFSKLYWIILQARYDSLFVNRKVWSQNADIAIFRYHMNIGCCCTLQVMNVKFVKIVNHKVLQRSIIVFPVTDNNSNKQIQCTKKIRHWPGEYLI